VRPELVSKRGDSDDPRLGDVVVLPDDRPPALRVGQPVLIGFPCDEGVRRNKGRTGAALAPDSIRECLYRLTAIDAVTRVNLATLSFLDLGNVHIDCTLEQGQVRLASAVADLLRAGAVPIVLGGGHETAFGHFCGYVGAEINCAIINVDAHLDVRPYPNGGHSGSPFRQAIDHATRPLKAGRYVVIGAQSQSVAQSHADYVLRHGGRVHWLPASVARDWPRTLLKEELDRFQVEQSAVLLTVDADAFRQSDVPGTSAPSPVGINGAVWPEMALLAGASPAVRSIEVVEVNPKFDRDSQTCRWAALGIRQFLVGLALRQQQI
jgi:formiminoglutamase